LCSRGSLPSGDSVLAFEDWGKQIKGQGLLTASPCERKENNVNGFKGFYLEADARTWPRLSYVCHIRSTADSCCLLDSWSLHMGARLGTASSVNTVVISICSTAASATQARWRHTSPARGQREREKEREGERERERERGKERARGQFRLQTLLRLPPAPRYKTFPV